MYKLRRKVALFLASMMIAIAITPMVSLAGNDEVNVTVTVNFNSVRSDAKVVIKEKTDGNNSNGDTFELKTGEEESSDHLSCTVDKNKQYEIEVYGDDNYRVTSVTDNQSHSYGVVDDYYCVVDESGAKSAVSFTQDTSIDVSLSEIDNEAPTIAVDQSVYYINSAQDDYKEITVEGTADDNKGLYDSFVLLSRQELDASKVRSAFASPSDYDVTSVSVVEGRYDFSLNAAGTYHLYALDKNELWATTAVTVIDDTTAPKITNYKVREYSEDHAFDIAYIFGKFFTRKEDITIHVDASDSESGVQTITLYEVDGSQLKKLDEKTNLTTGAIDFQRRIPIGTKNQQKYVIRVTDRVNNSSDISQQTDKNSFVVRYDSEAPKAEIKADKLYRVGDDKVYIHDFEGFEIEVSDNDSLKSVQITMGGVELKNETYGNGKTSNKVNVANIDTSAMTQESDGSYKLRMNVFDGANNTLRTNTFYIYLDNTAPVIKCVNGVDVSERTSKYEIFAHDVTTLELQVDDYTDNHQLISGGVDRVYYELKDAKGQVASTGYATLDGNSFLVNVSGDFKGFLYAKGIDQLGNGMEDAVVAVSSGIVVESSAHANENTLINLSAADTECRDEIGNPLYASNTVVKVQLAQEFSGIQSVEYRVEAPFDTSANYVKSFDVADATAVKNQGFQIDKAEDGIVTRVSGVIPVTNNSNNIMVEVIVTGNAGNRVAHHINVSIDKTTPIVSVTYSEAGKNNDKYYNENHTATIQVKDRNFDPSKVQAGLNNTTSHMPAISEWSKTVDSGNPDNTTYTATITFSEDGEYTLNCKASDRAGNESNQYLGEQFIIDKTAPNISVTFDNDNATNGKYYKSARTATITVKDNNFDERGVKVSGTSSDNGAGISFPAIGGWSKSGENNTANIVFGADGTYHFTIEAKDLAGNDGKPVEVAEFVIDLQEPTVTFSGVENNTAYNSNVSPAVTFADTNFDMATTVIELRGMNHGTVSYASATNQTADGQTVSFADFPYEKAVDDIYVLTATGYDMAGNMFSDSVTFSVNRFGSNYTLDAKTKELDGTYITTPIDVVITETNVDELRNESMQVVLTKDGVPRTLELGKDYKVSNSATAAGWHQYQYVIDKEQFANDGAYSVAVYSEDAAGNINESTLEDKEAELNFGVDNTMPIVEPMNLESNGQYNTSNYRATVQIKDNLVLGDVVVKVDGKDVKCDASGDNYSFIIPESVAKQNIEITAKDAAGNERDIEVDDVLVSTNFFARWYNNTPIFIVSIGGTAAVGAGIWTVLARKGKWLLKIKK